MRSSEKLLFVFLLSLLFYFGCGPSTGGIKSDKPKVYVDMPFKKIISPLFRDETSGKYVHFNAILTYDWGVNGPALVADEYKSGYEVVTLRDIDEASLHSEMCVIPYSLKESLLEVKLQDTLEIWAYLQPTPQNPYIVFEKFNKATPK
jgi:hypothetical protein